MFEGGDVNSKNISFPDTSIVSPTSRVQALISPGPPKLKLLPLSPPLPFDEDTVAAGVGDDASPPTPATGDISSVGVATGDPPPPACPDNLK